MTSLGGFAREQARRFGDKPLFLAGEASLTYRYPEEIENVLHGHPAVLECAVVGVPDAVKGEIPKACVVLKEGGRATEAEIKAFCRESLAAYKVPRLVEFLPGLPTTATGKIRKGELAAS